jgi:hypothetical protein
VWLAFDACERDQDRLDDVKVLAIIARPARGPLGTQSLSRECRRWHAILFVTDANNDVSTFDLFDWNNRHDAI